MFRVNALAGTERHGTASSTQDQAGDEGSSSLSTQFIESETEYDPWPEIEEQIAGLVGEETRVTVSPASASVTVSGAPADVRTVRGYLAWLNREVLRPVTLSAHLYSVRFERETDHGVELSLSELLGSSAGVTVAGDTISVIRPSGAEDTLAAAVRALSRAGTVSRVLSADIPSLNGKPAQFLELVSEAYLKELRTTAGEGLAQTELVPGTVSSGFALSYLARITGPDEVLVRLSASLRDRPQFTTFTTDGHTIQLPAYGGRAVQVTRRIGRGETLVVTGVQRPGGGVGQAGQYRRGRAGAAGRAQRAPGARGARAADRRRNRRAIGNHRSARGRAEPGSRPAAGRSLVPGGSPVSVLDVGGRRFAAGLYWLERGGAASVARNARAFGRPWHVHRGEQTG